MFEDLNHWGILLLTLATFCWFLLGAFKIMLADAHTSHVVLCIAEWNWFFGVLAGILAWVLWPISDWLLLVIGWFGHQLKWWHI